MPHSLRKYLADIENALYELSAFSHGKTMEDYLSNVQMRRAIEREFIIIGEAMAKIVHQFPETKTRIDNARRIADFRNFLVHEYGDVNDELVWAIVVKSVPLLAMQIRAWAKEIDAA